MAKGDASTMLRAIAGKPVGSSESAPPAAEPPVPVQSGPIPDTAPPAGFDQAFGDLRADNSIQFDMQPYHLISFQCSQLFSERLLVVAFQTEFS